MNVRALALGAVIGFVVAFSPSCSPAKCGPQNCDGCCDPKGTCVKKPNNNNNTTCGSAGNACVDCAAAGSTCNPSTSTCGSTGAGGGGGGTAGGTGGGSAGGTGGGGAACDGCQLPMSGTCIALARTSVTNCGRNNAFCMQCGPGENCDNGVCTLPPSMKKIGDPCVDDMECQGTGTGGLGANAICKKMTSTGNGTYNMGYCTFRCGTAAGQCPMGSFCVGLPPQYGEEAICWDQCTPGSATDRCRAGYGCYGLTSGASACWISPLPPPDAGVPADKVGNACSATGECVNPPETGGVCLSREFNYNWTAVGGYCSKAGCVSDPECSTDGGAICLELAENESACVQRCPQDGGQSTCRNGFVCERLFFNDGGVSPNGFCAPPPAPSPESIGGACVTDTDCSIPTGAIADCLPPTLTDGGPSGYTAGYCTRFDCMSNTDCSPDGGAQCFGIGANATACFQTCPSSDAGQSTCRAGFVCEPYRLGDGGLSQDGVCDRACNAVGAPACASGSTCNMTTGYCE